ncbi:MAG: acyl-ACP--UDP-N-acetylglucosamine O-acyltransferase [Rhodospirillaceae bacterium]|jgi:UDP-N-acetylglucosamine acyltransferase|nr:acyl-ACP--UDP-N-acetylglucosamine O-acyltransferase [Rhodospirillaceae bacterium]MBT4045472.1 acyl-ACP--UDP-N-acetylglucosamine O-acyltransferase [Rhodospirillaceae bacterium]MBT4690648.1 acyl-ACP--UDP-N-acetylglucosamine O-acyltransferase [Rhodospirillaceae bacterium]MBT5080556.1 acyl-ACP--UDP-N-acetylglucosamine O-acyltransferase [Rhodospirillaceae bacterium]MBT5526575.1 acyl-ACP--UDP-N-acetylglucosamine O-acyltransferase [Rhodospirillaceae bacterium]
MVTIHPTAIVEAGAELGDGVKIGPFCTVSAQARLGDGVVLDSHVVVAGNTTIGPNNRVYPFAAIGTAPQDTKYAGEPSELILGANNVIREHVTMHPGTVGGGSVTRVGNNCLIMVGVHVAHDCQVADHVILVNNVILGGHVEVQDHAILGGMSAVHQFVRIGRHAMVGGKSAVDADVIPYGSVLGNRAYLSGLNIVGLKRRGFERDEIHGLRAAYRLLFAQEGTMQERIVDVAAMFADHEQVMEIVAFIQADSSRALCQPKLDRAA